MTETVYHPKWLSSYAGSLFKEGECCLNPETSFPFLLCSQAHRCSLRAIYDRLLRMEKGEHGGLYVCQWQSDIWGDIARAEIKERARRAGGWPP